MQYNTPRMPSNMSQHFLSLPKVHRPRSTFIAPFELHTAHDAQYIYPFFMLEVLPGDTINFSGKALSRLITPIKPFMSNLYLDFHIFYSPNRLDWENWQKFMGERLPDPDSSIDFLMPQMYLPGTTGWAEDSLQDYLNYGPPGVPGNGTSTYSVHNMYGRAYNNIWNLYYRDQNYQDSAPHDTDNGPDAVSDYVLRKRNKRLDYFTGILPTPQKGAAQALFLGGTAPVYGGALAGNSNDGASGYALFQSWNQPTTGQSYGALAGSSGGGAAQIRMNDLPGGGMSTNWNDSSTATLPIQLATEAQYTAYNAANIYTDASPPFADLDLATSNTINEFRLAAVVQQFLELDARGGTRYIEMLLSHWGVISPDFRLQRPELIGASTLVLNMVSVPQTSETLDTSDTPQGNLAAYALFNGRVAFNHSFVEHGRILGLMSVRSDLSYQRGVNRELSRLTRFDFYDPLFANIGEQAVLGKELSLQGLAGGLADARVIGYQEAWSEYRYINSVITGAMRSTHSLSLDVWHLAQELAADVDIDDQFMVDAPPIERVTAVDSYQFQTNIFAQVRMARVMPTYSVPGLIRL